MKLKYLISKELQSSYNKYCSSKYCGSRYRMTICVEFELCRACLLNSSIMNGSPKVAEGDTDKTSFKA